MIRSKTIKKRTKNRLTLLKNLRKGKARLEPRCHFNHIPQPNKLAFTWEVHHLYGDIVLMEFEDKIVTEPSLLNKFKVLKQAHIVESQGQRAVRVLLESKGAPFTDWRALVEKLGVSEVEQKREWAGLVQGFCERYESMLKKIGEDRDSDTPNSVIRLFRDIDKKTQKMRQNLWQNYPCGELKSQYKNGQIELMEIVYNEKYILELGHTVDSFSTLIVNEGLPKVIKFDSETATMMAKWRLENYLSIPLEGAQTPEMEAVLLMKSGFMKKTKFKFFYQITYEKGVPGFSMYAVIVAKQAPFLEKKEPEVQVDSSFVEMMANKERESAEFLSAYYNTSTEQRYTNLNKVCKIKEI